MRSGSLDPSGAPASVATPRSLYNESLAGRQEFRPDSHQFLKPVSPFDERGKLLPYIVRQEDLVATGEGDNKILSYCFRVCLTDVEANRIPFSPPANYDARRYGLVRNYLERAGRELTRRQFFGLSALPNGKYDLNSGGAVSTNLPGAAWEYPEATYRRRQEIWREHLSWTQGLLYFLSHDPTSPETLRTEINRLGLPRDEFIDNEHWPTQLYIREARRMLGEYVLTQHDLQKYRRKYDSIGMGGYNIDIREVQWIAFKVFHFPRVQDEVISEGYVSMPVDPYEIPYRSLLPRQQECDNLLVPVCISASQVAYGSFRMEPQFMIAGHCAGTAAALAIRAGVALHRIDIGLLQQKLRAQGQVLSLE